VAVSIFSIAIVAIIEGIALSARTQLLIENQSRALMYAQNIMAEIEYVGEARVGSDSGQYTGDDSMYAWATEIIETDLEGLYEVRVMVSWNEGVTERDVQLVTYYRAKTTADALATETTPEATAPGTRGSATAGNVAP